MGNNGRRCLPVYPCPVRRGRVALIAVLVAAVAVAATVTALAIGHRGGRPPRAAARSTQRPTTTTRTATGSTAGRTKSPPPTIAPTTTATTVVGRVDSLLYINGINQTASDVSSIIIASCAAGTPSSIEVKVSSLVSKTPTGSIDWQLDDEPAQLFPLTGGRVTIPYLCPMAVPPNGSVQVSISYAGDSNFFASAVIAQLGVMPG
jgi:hypothetical protein